MHQSYEPVNDVMNCHHFLRSNFGTNFNYIPCLEVEILGREGGDVYVSLESIFDSQNCIQVLKLPYSPLILPPKGKKLH